MAIEKRKPRAKLNEKQIEHLLAVSNADITKNWLRDTFAITEKGQFMPWDGEFELDTSKIHAPMPKMPSSKFTTTAGRYIVNRFLFGESEYTKITTYINEPMTAKMVSKIQNVFLKGVLEKQILPKHYVDFLNKLCWIAFSSVNYCLSGLNTGLFNETPELVKTREKLFKENKEKLEKLDLTACTTVDKTCNQILMDENKDNKAIDFINAGDAKKFMGVTSVMRGLVPDSTGYGIRFVGSSLQGGIKADEIAAYADTGILGAKSRGLDTRNSGYLTKKFNSAFSHIVLDEPGSDCKTKYKLKIKINDRTGTDYYLRYAYYGGKEYILDTETIKKLMGKEVQIRSPMYCTGNKICNKCAGELYYRMDNRFMGLAVARIGSNLLQASLKSFHDSTVKVSEIDLEKYTRKI